PARCIAHGGGTAVVVVAPTVIRRVHAPRGRVAGIIGAGNAVVTVGGWPADARLVGTGIIGRAGVAVVAGRRVGRVHAARGGVAGIVGADVLIVAGGGRTADARPMAAGGERTAPLPAPAQPPP